MPQFGLQNILKIFDKSWHHYVQLTWIQLCIYGDKVKRSIRTQDSAPTNIRELWITINIALFNIFPEVFQPLGKLMSHQVLVFLRRNPTQYHTPIPWLLACLCIIEVYPDNFTSINWLIRNLLQKLICIIKSDSLGYYLVSV